MTLTAIVLVIMSACDGNGAMDKENVQKLRERYGNPIIINLKKAGTLEEMLKSKKHDEKIKYLSISGPMNGADFAFLNDSLGYDVQALDLLDVQLVPSEDVYGEYLSNDSALTIKRADIIPTCLFHEMHRLEQLFLPKNIKEIGEEAFGGSLMHLEYIHIPASVKSIGKNAFCGCSALSSLHLPDGLTTIEEMAFYSSSLVNIRIPQNAKDCHKKAFSGKINEFYLSWTPEELEKMPEYDFVRIVFDENPPQKNTIRWIYSGATLYVPSEYVDAYKKKFPRCTVIADETNGEPLEPSFIMGNSSIGPLRKDLTILIPKQVGGLYDSYKHVKESLGYEGDEDGIETLQFYKDGKMTIKAFLNDDASEITGFIVYTSCVQTPFGLYAGCPVTKLSRIGSWLEWSHNLDITQSCTDNTYTYHMENESLNEGLDWATSHEDFKEGATISFIQF